MTCNECKHARRLVNSNRRGQVGCGLSLRNEHQEEYIISSLIKVDYSMVYESSLPIQKKKGRMKKGLVIDSNFTCHNFMENKNV